MLPTLDDFTISEALRPYGEHSIQGFDHVKAFAHKIAEMDRAMVAATIATTPDLSGTWLWTEFMGFCKKRGYAPAEFDDLFAICRKAYIAADATQPPESVPLSPNSGDGQAEARRSAFEVAYSIHATESTGRAFDVADIRALREDDHYGSRRTYLNNLWNHWQETGMICLTK